MPSTYGRRLSTSIGGNTFDLICNAFFWCVELGRPAWHVCNATNCVNAKNLLNLLVFFSAREENTRQAIFITSTTMHISVTSLVCMLMHTQTGTIPRIPWTQKVKKKRRSKKSTHRWAFILGWFMKIVASHEFTLQHHCPSPYSHIGHARDVLAPVHVLENLLVLLVQKPRAAFARNRSRPT